jgi:hypothetical protein
MEYGGIKPMAFVTTQSLHITLHTNAPLNVPCYPYGKQCIYFNIRFYMGVQRVEGLSPRPLAYEHTMQPLYSAEEGLTHIS